MYSNISRKEWHSWLDYFLNMYTFIKLSNTFGNNHKKYQAYKKIGCKISKYKNK